MLSSVDKLLDMVFRDAKIENAQREALEYAERVWAATHDGAGWEEPAP